MSRGWELIGPGGNPHLYIEMEGAESLVSDIVISSAIYQGEFGIMIRDLDVTLCKTWSSIPLAMRGMRSAAVNQVVSWGVHREARRIFQRVLLVGYCDAVTLRGDTVTSEILMTSSSILMPYPPSEKKTRTRGDDEVELTDEEFFDNKDEIAEVFRIETNIFNYETPICSAFNEFNYLLKVDLDLLIKDIMRFKTYDDYKDDWIYKWNKDVPWVDEKPWTDTGVWTEPKPVIHTCKLFNYKTGCSEWPTCSWINDGYCNGGNIPGTFIIENQLHYQDYEWYKALEDSELKDEALRNKAIMERFIKDDDDESIYEQMRRWDIYTNYDDTYKTNHDDN
ncbi:hypothetical protein Tco_1082795 [Tanacetum coccineum]|uniref:Uncharacterized protein n=1 Tax=Tanacetum coccineum TaxID=301880 RepID=A0ABQ5I1N8_9ASTR